ncbi:unnamed protein product [Lactuca saligna]|uniref:t-SNARE coiled-coil homology domain-containing protein n=1 Tax=Lactuca saligna TaxID=75948 RepID=A0AA35VHM0_LACSI|nr:unnamed protein product [Lactuca saligna]
MATRKNLTTTNHLRHLESMATHPSGAGKIRKLNVVILGESLASEEDDLVFPGHDFSQQAYVPSPQKYLELEIYNRSIEDPGGFWYDMAHQNSIGKRNGVNRFTQRILMLQMGTSKLRCLGLIANMALLRQMFGELKKTLVMALLRKMFGASTEKVKVEKKTWKVDNCWFGTDDSFKHPPVELNLSDAGFQDRYIVQEIITEMAKNGPINVKGKKGFKEKLKQASETDHRAEVSTSKKIIDAKLAKDFQAVLKEFHKARCLSAERETIYTPFVPQTVLPSRQEVLLLDNEIAFNEAIIEEREIQNQIGEVNEIFKDLVVLVHEQGAMIDDIGSNIENSHAATAQARIQLSESIFIGSNGPICDGYSVAKVVARKNKSVAKSLAKSLATLYLAMHEWCGIPIRQISSISDFLKFAAAWVSALGKRSILKVISFSPLWYTWLARNDKVFKKRGLTIRNTTRADNS